MASALATAASSLSSYTVIPPYFEIMPLQLPALNRSASASNPLKGFLTSPDWMAGHPEGFMSQFQSLDYYLVGLSDIMDGPNSFSGFDTYLEPRLEQSANRSRHVILRLFLDEPGVLTHVPRFLLDRGLKFNSYDAYGGGMSPDYSDENLMTAIENFIAAFGRRYDGDPRVGFIQQGLLGFWGEWHTYTPGNGEEGWISDEAKERVTKAYANSFSKTKIQARLPVEQRRDGTGAKFGMHDDSFAFATLDGEANGGVKVRWFFWPKVESANYTDFWKSDAMSAELYPPLQATIFNDNYPRRTFFHQDFDECIRVTHTTYVVNHYALCAGYEGNALWRATQSSNLMGYDFIVSGVDATYREEDNTIDVAVMITQIGVAPFYYPLGVYLRCNDADTGNSLTFEATGVDSLLEEHEKGRFSFRGLPPSESCLGMVSFELHSPWAYPGRPVKFAQGVEGAVSVSIPLPPDVIRGRPGRE